MSIPTEHFHRIRVAVESMDSSTAPIILHLYLIPSGKGCL